MSALITTFGINWELLLTQAVNFAIVVAALWYFLYKPVGTMLAKRQAMVAKGVHDAEAAAKELAEAGARAQGIVVGAESEAETIVKSARTAANEQSAKAVALAEARAAQIAKDADARAAETAARTLRESEQEIARLAVLAASRVLATGKAK